VTGMHRYMDRVELAKKKRENEAIEREKVSEKSRREITHVCNHIEYHFQLVFD
jgi:hypothetical protein